MKIRFEKKKNRRTIRNCKHCGNVINSYTKKCSFCGEYVYSFTEGFTQRARNKLLLRNLRSGNFTLQDVSDRYGITRERVRQIWKASEGKGFTKFRDKQKRTKARERKEFLKTIKFHCSACKKPVTHKEAFRKHNLCKRCSYILMVLKRDPYVLFTCEICGREYHPQRNHKAYNSKRKFCTTECYFDRCLVI